MPHDRATFAHIPHHPDRELMRQIAMEHLAPGMVLAQSLSAPGDGSRLPLVAAGVAITESIKRRLVRAGIERAYIDDDASRGIMPTPAITNETRATAVTVVRDAFADLRTDESQISHEKLKHVDAAISAVIAEISGRPGLLVCLSDLNMFGGERIHDSVNACVIGISIADRYFAEHGWRDYRGKRRDDRIHDRLGRLGVGLLLADIGMLTLPENLRSGATFMSANERAMVQQHPLTALELLEGADVSPLVKVTIAQHHERFDGSGYPRGISGSDLHELGQLAAIADAWVALTSSARNGENAVDPHTAWHLISNSADKLFAADLVNAFERVVTPYGASTPVALSDGRCGVVRRANAADPLRPVVRVTHDADGMPYTTEDDIDLLELPRLSITGIRATLPGDQPTVVAGSSRPSRSAA